MEQLVNAVDFPVVDKVNAIGGIFIALATYVFGEHWVLFAAFLLLNVLDYITGVMKSRIQKTECSSVGLVGIIKKLSYWIIIVIAFGMSPILNEIGEVVGADISVFTPLIGWFVLAAMGLNELRSVLENLVESGVPVPTVLTKGLKVAQKVLVDKINFELDKLDGALDVGDDPDNPYRVSIDTPKEELEEKDTVTLKIRTVHREDD